MQNASLCSWGCLSKACADLSKIVAQIDKLCNKKQTKKNASKI